VKRVYIVLRRFVHITDDYDNEQHRFRPDDELKMIAASRLSQDLNRDLGFFDSVAVEKIEDVR
jgi:hypothetical protein